MRIALINSPSLPDRPVSRSMAGGLGFDGSEAMILPPLDLAIMAATLRQAGETVEVIDADPLRLSPAAIYSQLGDRHWDMVIATVSLPTLTQDAAFLAELRRRHPGAKIIGKTLIRDHAVLQKLLAISTADFVIHGEADLAITEIAHGRSRGGTAWLEAGPSTGIPMFHFEEGTPVEDLNLLPFAARDLLPNDRYVYPLLGMPVATLQTSRGCPYPCGYYCPYPLVEGVKWRSQTAERIFAELKDVVEGQGITKIYFRDATFTLNQDRVVKLCEMIIVAGWTIQWVCETRIDCLGDALLDRMRQAGCVGLLVGVETGDERVMHLPEGKKGVTVTKLAHLREKTRQLGIRLHFLLIVGLPQETRESLVATYDLIQRYKPDTIGVTIITPYPGTPLHEQGLREGWIDSHDWRDYGGHQVPMHTPNLTKEDMETGKRFLDEGFALLQRRQIGGHSAPLEALAKTHYENLLRWAYHLAEPIAQLRQVTAASAAPRGAGRPVPQASLAVMGVSRAETPAGLPAMPLSVVIPTYNRRAILRKTLLAFASQTVGPDQFEMLVVDDGSSDDTLQMLERFKASFPLRIFKQHHQGANAARNLAIREAKGALVLLTGDDMIPEPAFVEAHLKFHASHPSELDAMLGFIDWSPEMAVTPFMKFLVSPDGGQQFSFPLAQDGKVDFRQFYTSNISLKRSLLQKQSILFDTDFTYPAYDDIELGYRLAKQGVQIHYNAKATTSHFHEMTPQSFAQRQRKAGHMARVLVRKHPELAQLMKLGIEEIVRSRDTYSEQRVQAFLTVLAELEKPDLGVLNQVQVNGKGYDRFYTRSVLHPLYQSLLQSAYALGLCEAAKNDPNSDGSSSPRTYTASIIIPVWNKVELTKQCLIALAHVTTDVSYEVIVVDNGSTDGTHEFLQTLSGDVRVITNATNLGFAKACNQGAAVATGEYLVFLNNDTIPLDGWLRALVDEVTAHAEVIVVGSKLLYQDRTVQHAGVAVHRFNMGPYHIYRGSHEDHPAVNKRRELNAVTGACLLIRRGAFGEVGGFDEGFVNGFEDVDLCFKVRENKGRIVYQPKSVLFHLESQTPGRNQHDAVNAQRLLERWRHAWWLVDDDSLYQSDGYKTVVCERNGKMVVTQQLIDNEQDRRAWELVAATQRAGHQRDEAAVVTHLGKCAEWPADRWVLKWAAGVAEAIQQPGLATEFTQRVALLDDPAREQVMVVREALAKGQVTTAASRLEALLKHYPSHAEGLLLGAILHMQREQYREAEMAFTTALNQGADRKKCLMGIGMASMGRAYPQGAWQSFLRVLAEHPDDAEVIHWLLRAGTAQNRWQELSVQLRNYLARNPSDLSVRFAYASVLLRAEQIEAARQEYNQLEALAPTYDGLSELGQAIAGKEAVLAMDVSG